MNWILVPLRNNLAFIRAALPTFLAQDVGDVRVFLWDNGSTDGTSAWANSITDDRVTYVYNAQPKSVAASWNAMLRYVFEQGETHALVVNADVELRPDTYRHLVADGGLFVTAVGTADKSKIAPPYNAPDPAMKRRHPDFSTYLIRRECWDRMGPFNEDCIGGYVEDSFAHMRMHEVGIVAECLELPFYHVGAGTLKNADEAETTRIQQQADKNRALFKQKYGVEVGSEGYYALFGHGAPEEKEPEPVKAESPQSKVNIVLVTNFSRRNLLAQTLRTLYENTPEDQFNLTIVCDGFPSEADLITIGQRENSTVISEWPPCHIIGRLKNLGAYWSEKQVGRGEWLCFIDDDMAFFPGWLTAITGRFPHVEKFGQPIRIIGGIRHPFHQVTANAYSSDSTMMNPDKESVEITDAVAGYCHFMRWSTWDKFGPYDAHAKGTGQSEDWKLCNDIVKADGRVGYIHPPVMAHCGITNSNGNPILGGDLIERVPGVLYL